MLKHKRTHLIIIIYTLSPFESRSALYPPPPPQELKQKKVFQPTDDSHRNPPTSIAPSPKANASESKKRKEQKRL